MQLLIVPLGALAEAAQPYLSKMIIDRHVIPQVGEGLWMLVVAFMGVLALGVAVRYATYVLGVKVGVRSVHDLRVAGFHHVLGRSRRFFDKEPVGRVMTRMTSDLEAIGEMCASGIVLVLADLFRVALILGILFWLSVKLALVTVAAMVAVVLLMSVFRNQLRRIHRRIREAAAKLNIFIQEHLTGTKVVSLFVRQRPVLDSFDELNRNHANTAFASIRADALLFSLTEAVSAVALAAVLWVAGKDLLAAALSFGTLVAFIGYIQQLFGPIRDLTAKFAVMQAAMAGSEKVFSLLDTETPDALKRAVPDDPSISGKPDLSHVSYHRVSFGYKKDDPVLTDFSLKVAKGETLAIVGPTGCGKTTAVSLLVRLYEPDGGVILIDGAPVDTLDPADLRRRVTLVTQDPVLFSGTIRDNILLDARELGADTADKAAEAVGLSRILKIRGRSLDDEVKEGGANLSAGERQLVCFARALAHDPEILVLDEATSHVDPESEAALRQGTARLVGGRTAIVVAHRLSTVRHADRIAVLDRGRVAELGTHESLLKKGGLYAALWKLYEDK
jgi:ATP-binding cassette subfamily B protein